MTVKQKHVNTANHILIKLVPLQADLIAVLRTDAQVVRSTDSVTLNASTSYDLDKVQVNALQLMQDHVHARLRWFAMV